MLAFLRFIRGVTDGEYRYVRNFHPHRHRGIRAGFAHGQVGWQSLYKLQQAGELNDVQSAYWSIPQPVEELYHTTSDPWEVKNLADDPQQKERLAKMRAALLDKMRDVRDTGIVPESMYTSISKDSTVYDYVNSDRFPYEEALQAALMAGGGLDPQAKTETTEIVEALTAAMQHEHPVIRYWGAMGCTIHGKAVAETKGPLKQLLQDPSPSVRVAAAEAIYVLGDEAAGFDGLISILKESTDPIVVLEALNITEALGVMEDVPKNTWSKACQVGSYCTRMENDQQDP